MERRVSAFPSGLAINGAHLEVGQTMALMINPKKLLNSKWTALKPQNKEKHFIISEIEFDEEGQVLSCSIEAIMTKRSALIQWQSLKDPLQWQQGWK